MKKIFIGIVFAVVAAGTAYGISFFIGGKSNFTEKFMLERITFSTSDGVKIVGDYAGETSQPAVLLLHMMPATRESWRAFSEKLNAVGFQTLAIDLLGHGESSGGPKGYKAFSDAEHQMSINDVTASVDFLRGKTPTKIFIAGASIGANLALQFAAEHTDDIEGAVLLSPGLDYRGLRTEPYVSRLREGQRVYFAASRDDPYSADTVDALFVKTPVGVKKEIKIFEKAGHGTTMFDGEPSLMNDIVAWFQE